MADSAQRTPQYFAKIKSCEPFFVFDEKNNTIETVLDNPKEPKITVQSDHIFMSYYCFFLAFYYLHNLKFFSFLIRN